MKKLNVIFLVLIVAIVLLVLFFKQKSGNDNEKLTSKPAKLEKHKSVVKKNITKNQKSPEQIIETNVTANVVSSNKPYKLAIGELAIIPSEPCPADHFDVYVDEALQTFRKNLSYEEKDKALQNVDAIGMPMIMPVIMLALDDENSEIRNTAIDAIQSLDDPCVIPAVEKALEDKDPINRMDAVNALMNVKDTRINDALIKAIKDQNEDVRETAFEVMLVQESPIVLPAAEAAAQMDDPEIQSQAINVLEDIPAVEAIDAIINYGLLSEYDEIRETAKESLQKLTGQTINGYNE